jgi:hypothetical protein
VALKVAGLGGSADLTGKYRFFLSALIIELTEVVLTIDIVLWDLK